jgi:hypothetical protein
MDDSSKVIGHKAVWSFSNRNTDLAILLLLKAYRMIACFVPKIISNCRIGGLAKLVKVCSGERAETEVGRYQNRGHT